MDSNVSYVVFESVCARFERTIKRLWVLLIILVVMLVGSNCAWLWYESQYESIETTTETYEADADDDGYSRRYSGRDAMGRYSGHQKDAVDELKDLMRDVPDEGTRRKIQTILNHME